MSRRRTLILQKPPAEDDPSAPLEPLGAVNDLVATLASHNISPDGSGPDGLGNSPGVATLYGPGLVVEIPLSDNGPISQVMVSLSDEDFAFPVLARVCRTLGWRMVDPDSGRSFG